MMLKHLPGLQAGAFLITHGLTAFHGSMALLRLPPLIVAGSILSLSQPSRPARRTPKPTA